MPRSKQKSAPKPEARERKSLYPGGLMRCRVKTWDKHTGSEDEGTVLPCMYCESSMIVKGNAWRWNHA